MYFSSIEHHIISHLAKFENKTLLVRGEMRRRNLSWGQIRLVKQINWIGKESKMDFFFSLHKDDDMMFDRI